MEFTPDWRLTQVRDRAGDHLQPFDLEAQARAFVQLYQQMLDDTAVTRGRLGTGPDGRRRDGAGK